MAAKRKAISLEIKKDLINDAQNGIKNNELCKKYNLDRTTVSMILKNKFNILTAIEKGASEKRARIYKHNDLDEAMLEWIKTINDKNISLNGPMIKKKALELSKKFPGKFTNKFVASNGWLVRFRARHSIKLGCENNKLEKEGDNLDKLTTSFSNSTKEEEDDTEGFAYTKHRPSVDGQRTYWRCERRSSLTGCHGRAVTIGQDEEQPPVVLTVHHNHPPSEKYGPLTGGTGAHGWAVGGDIVGATTNATNPPTNLRGIPIVPKVSRCDIAKKFGENFVINSRKRKIEVNGQNVQSSQLPVAFSSLPPFIGDGEPPNLTMAEDDQSPQNFTSYSTMEQFFNSQNDNLPPFLESVEDGFNQENLIKRSKIGEINDNNEGEDGEEVYSNEGIFDQNNQEDGNNINGNKINLDQLKKEWDEISSYDDPSQPSPSSNALASSSTNQHYHLRSTSTNSIKNNSPKQQTNNNSFGGTVLIREKSQLDFLLPLPSNNIIIDGKQIGYNDGSSTNNIMKQMQSTLEWENDPRTIELRKQLNDSLDRERNYQHKAQKTADELLDVRAELDVINAKNERLEKRLKNANDELASLREQLDQSMDHRETLERQQFELNLKESRKRAELQREFEAKEDEIEEMRIQYQRKIRTLESALEDAQLENSSLIKQKKAAAAWQRNNNNDNSQSVSMNGSLLDLAQTTSNVNRNLKKKLANALALLQSAQISFDKDLFESNSSQLRSSKQNLGSTIFSSSVCEGSELFDELDDLLLEEEKTNMIDASTSENSPKNADNLKELKNKESCLLTSEKIENFDGANSDTVEDSSCGAEEIIQNEQLDKTSPSRKKHYRSHDVLTKLEAVNFAKNNSVHSASRKFNVDRKIIRNWIKNEKELELQLIQPSGENRKRLGGGGRKVSNPEMEKELIKWVKEMGGSSD